MTADTILFRTLPADSGWYRSALLDTLVHGLSSGIKDQLIYFEIPDELDPLIALRINIHKRIMEREKEWSNWRTNPISRVLMDYKPEVPILQTPPETQVSSSPPAAGKLMHLGWTQLTPEERHNRL